MAEGEAGLSACRHERRRDVVVKNPMEKWIDTYCLDCKVRVIEHRGVWIVREAPNHHALLECWRDEQVRLVTEGQATETLLHVCHRGDIKAGI